jgi:selenocysteine lyase/cysteine desulfurase
MPDTPRWDADPGWLNTASYGLPPTAAWEALQSALVDWRGGRTSWEGWGEEVERSRALFARLVHVPTKDVAVGATVSQLLAPIAAALPDGARVLVPAEEFTSAVFPWAVHAGRGVEVLTAPAVGLAAAVAAHEPLDAVAFSLVQSSTGTVADLDAVLDAAEAVGALTVVDASQAAGWLDVDATRADAVVAAAYKWLMSPRGSAFLTLRPSLAERVVPLAAGWYAAEDVHGSYYGLPMRLARDARRFDISPAWFSWVGTTPALEAVLALGVDTIGARDVALANRFRRLVGLPDSDSAIVSVEADPGAAARLAAAGLRVAGRAGRLRLAFHVYSTDDEADRAADAVLQRG